MLDYLTPVNRLKIMGRKGTNSKPLPDNWADFAKLTEIRSGEGIIKFNPFPYQSQLVDTIKSHKLTIVGKSRQLGISETICNFFLYRACVDRSVLAVILSLGQRETIDLARRVRFAIESLAPMGITTSTDTLTDIQINGGGRLLFRPSNENSTRGLPAVTHTLLDEAGFVDNADRIYQAVIPATSTVADPKIVVVSTPNGATGWYHSLLASGGDDLVSKCDLIRDGLIKPYQQWSAGNTGKALIHWRCHPKFSQQADYLARIAKETGLSETVIAQEYDLSFSDSEDSAFSPILIRSAAVLEAMEKTQIEGAAYFIGIDPAGQGDDYTVGIVIKWDREQQQYSLVDMYRKRKQSTDYDIVQLADLIEKYQPLAVGVEVNSIGHIYSEQLARALPEAPIKRITTTQDSKNLGVGRINMLLEKNQLLMPRSSPLVEEMLSFRRKGKKLEAIAGKHDDTVMALSFALEVSPFLFKKQLTN